MYPIAIQTKSANLTEEQFFRLCTENKELRFERDKNKNIIIMSPTGLFTGHYHSEILVELGNWNKQCKLGYVFDYSSGFTLPSGAMRAPDVAWIAKERWEKLPQQDKESFGHICPDFVIEVRSKTDSLKSQQEKMQEWIENGCRLAWLIDLAGKKTYIYKANKSVEVFLFSKKLSGEKVLPGFELHLSTIIEN